MSRLQNSIGLGLDAEGNLVVPKDLKVVGKVGVNGATAVGKAADIGALSTTLSLALLTEVVTELNKTNKAVNEVRTTLRNAGLMT